MWEFSRCAFFSKATAAWSSVPRPQGWQCRRHNSDSFVWRQLSLYTDIPRICYPMSPRNGIDTPLDAAFDSAGNLWIVGSTTSDDFSLVNPIVAKKAPYRQSGFVVEVGPNRVASSSQAILAGRGMSSIPAPATLRQSRPIMRETSTSQVQRTSRISPRHRARFSPRVRT